MYAVTCGVIHTDSEGWTKTSATPTFYLHENVQGILDEEHAKRIALDVFDVTGELRNSGATIVITATKV